MMNNAERITKLEEMLERIQKELDKIKCSNNDNEYKVDTFERVKSQEEFYNITLESRITVFKHFEMESFRSYDKDCFENNNYFKSRERAEEVKSKIELLLRLERFYDTFCPEYKPNWNDSYELKYLSY